MCRKSPNFTLLFQQLGLPADEVGIKRFIRQHRPLPVHVEWQRAEFWTPAQAAVIWKLQRRGRAWKPVLAQLESQLRGEEASHA